MVYTSSNVLITVKQDKRSKKKEVIAIDVRLDHIFSVYQFQSQLSCQ